MQNDFDIEETLWVPSSNSGAHLGYSASFNVSIITTAVSLTLACVYQQNSLPELVDLPPISTVEFSVPNSAVDELNTDYRARTQMLSKLDELKERLKHNWNGEDDLPIEEQSYENAKSVIQSTPWQELKFWALVPNTNGTLLLSPNGDEIAGISIGNDFFSYAAYVSEDIKIGGKEPFTEQSFIAVIKHVNRFLGYV